MRARRAAQRRVARLGGITPRHPRDSGWSGAVLLGLDAVMGWFLSGLGFPAGRPLDHSLRRIRGVAVLCACALSVVSPPVAIVVGVVGWQLPNLMRSGQTRRIERALSVETMFATELCGVAISTGLGVPGTLDVITPHLSGRLGDALRRAMARYRSGVLLDVALSNVSDELGEAVAALTMILRAGHRDGDPIGPALTRLADRLREDHRRAVAADTRRLSIRLLLPLVACSLPGFVLIVIVPVAVGVLGAMQT